MLKDDRFASLFNDPDFSIDKESREFKMIHHNVTRMDEKAKRKQEKIVERFEEIEDTTETVSRVCTASSKCLCRVIVLGLVQVVQNYSAFFFLNYRNVFCLYFVMLVYNKHLESCTVVSLCMTDY